MKRRTHFPTANGTRSKSVIDPSSTLSPRIPNDLEFRSFIENLPVLFYAVLPEPPYSPLYVSPAFIRFGYPITDWLNDPEIWLRVIHEDDREWVFSRTGTSTASGKEVD
jgi:hypothetical protein